MQDISQPIEEPLDPLGTEPQEPVPQQDNQQDEKPVSAPSGEQASEQEAADWYQADSQAFKQEYPDVDREELFGREDFVDFAEGKIGELPMAEIYRRYLKWHTPPSARELARQASPGALGQARPPMEGEFFTLNEIRKMTPADIDRQWDKVQRSLKHISQ